MSDKVTIVKVTTVMAFCPECHGEGQFEITVTKSGTGFDGEREIHWFEGYGACHDCGYKGYYSDSN